MENIDQHINESSKAQMDDIILRNTKPRKPRGKQSDENRWNIDYIPMWKGKQLTLDYIYSMPENEREEVALFLFSFYRERGFPYPEYSDEEVVSDWGKLCKFDVSSIYNEDTKVLSSGSTTGNKIFKRFNPHFWESLENKKSKTAVDVFNDDELLLKIIRNRLGVTFYYRGVSHPFTISGNMIRQGMRSMRLIPNMTNFRPTIAKFIYGKYTKENDIVYDFSHGWSQRMIGAASLMRNLHYISVDPWGKQCDAGGNIIEALNLPQKNFTFYEQGSETFCPDDLVGSVNFAFSSPPYYDKEMYVDDEGQAYFGKTYEEFLELYWRKTCQNIYKLLARDGKFVFNVFSIYKKWNVRDDFVRIAEESGFDVTDEYFMKISKSHLSGKVGSDKLDKVESIVIFSKQ